MPTSCSRLSWPSLVSNGASSWHGTHHEAQTLTTLTLPLNDAGSSPGTGAPLLTRPSSAGSAVRGAAWPIRAEGIRDGSPSRKPNQNKAANATKPTSGNAISQSRRGDGASDGVTLDIVGSVICSVIL